MEAVEQLSEIQCVETGPGDLAAPCMATAATRRLTAVLDASLVLVPEVLLYLLPDRALRRQLRSLVLFKFLAVPVSLLCTLD
jgi:hypothetical protein